MKKTQSGFYVFRLRSYHMKGHGTDDLPHLDSYGTIKISKNGNAMTARPLVLRPSRTVSQGALPNYI